MKLWAAKDKTGYIGIYYEKPIWKETKAGIMDWEGHFMGYLNKQSFPEITFENSPQQVELKLIK